MASTEMLSARHASRPTPPANSPNPDFNFRDDGDGCIFNLTASEAYARAAAV